jgi:hypothetical protein
MNQRGRKSAAALAVIPLGQRQRPGPPKELTPSQAETWRSIVAGLPPEWFEKVPELLVAYCRHVETANVIAREIDAFDKSALTTATGIQRFNRLLSMGARESAVIAHLATKLRLTPQSRYTPHGAAAAANRTPAVNPWEIVRPKGI